MHVLEVMYKMFFDGASRRNPGPSSYGGVIYDIEGAEVDTFSACIGKATNNIAEYRGLLAGLHRISSLSKSRENGKLKMINLGLFIRLLKKWNLFSLRFLMNTYIVIITNGQTS